MLNIVLADPDEAYIDMLGSFIGVKCGGKAEVAVFTKLENLREYLSRCREVDILLTTPEFNNGINEDTKDPDKVKMKFLLCDKQTEEELGYSLFKYKPAANLLEEVLSRFAESGSKALGYILKGNRSTKIITVHSARGDSGKTLSALALCIQLSKLGYKTLYYNFETVSSLHFYLNDRASRPENMTSLLYYLRQDLCRLPLKLDAAMCNSSVLNISYMENPGCAFELCELTSEDMANLLHHLKTIGRFDVIVLDGDPGLNGVIPSVLSHSDLIVHVVSDSSFSYYKQRILEKELWKYPGLQHENLTGKSAYIINRCKNEKRSGTDQFPGNTFRIPVFNDMFLQSGRLMQLNLGGGFIKAFKEPATFIAKKVGLSFEEPDSVIGEKPGITFEEPASVIGGKAGMST